LHSACEFALETDGELPDCTAEEMWEKPTVWAVRKTGNKRAHSLYETEALASSALAELGDKYEMEVRPGERTRCTNFCPVNTWCQQYKQYVEEQA